MRGLMGTLRAGVVGLAASLTLGTVAPNFVAADVSARAAGPTDVVGAWTEPFEEGTAAVPRCRPAGDDSAGDPGASLESDPVVCKPTAVATAVLDDGRIFYFDGMGSQENAPGQARLLDLRSGTPKFEASQFGASPPTDRGGQSSPGIEPGPRSFDDAGDLFCADLTAVSGGKILMVGGTRNALLFDPETSSFQPAAPMKHGRCHPHVAIGPDGSPTVFGGVSRRTETFHADTNTWEENYAGSQSETELPLQPRIVLAPNGKFFYAAAGQMWGPFGQSAEEALTAFYQFFDPKTKAWEISGLAPYGARSGAFVVPLTLAPPYDQMTIATWGGVLGPPPGSWLPANPLTTLTTIDANGNVTNRTGGNLNHARWHSSGVLLPDGQLLAVGGADKDDTFDPGTGIAVNIPELYNPATGEWTEVAPHARDRGYRHSALLLPDMRVLLGGNAPIASHYGADNRDMVGPFASNDHDPSFEVWSPPYLFRGPRPTVKRVQKAVGYGETFNITTPDAGLIESVLLMRTPSPEHANDSDQRSLKLEFTRSGNTTLTATAPPSGNVAPPGPYYLVVNKKSLQGPIPSVAHMVEVGHTDVADARRPFPDDAPAPTGGSATPDEDTSNVVHVETRAAESLPATMNRRGLFFIR